MTTAHQPVYYDPMRFALAGLLFIALIIALTSTLRSRHHRQEPSHATINDVAAESIEGAIANRESTVPVSPLTAGARGHQSKYKAKREIGSVSSQAITMLADTNDHHESNPESHQIAIRDYTVEDGVAVIEGDIVVGDGPPGAASGKAQVNAVTPWPSHAIPYFIQPSLSSPERIEAAVNFFKDTKVQFIPYTNQKDVLVFEEASGACKSYMGKTGGKQPILISPQCSPRDIAHELMHALGFVHEQNRSDRDSFIHVNVDEIVSSSRLNFEKLPPSYMALSQLTDFDFNSIMMYPTSMFSRTGRPTMSSLKAGREIAPSAELSPKDVARINLYYSGQ